MLTLLRCTLITENKHLLRDPELSSVTRNCQYNIMQLDTLKIGIYKLKDFMNCIKVKRNNLLNSIYSSVSPDFRFKETPYISFFTDPELSSSLQLVIKTIIRLSNCFKTACMSYKTTHKIGIRLVIGRMYHISIEIFRRYRCFQIALG